MRIRERGLYRENCCGLRRAVASNTPLESVCGRCRLETLLTSHPKKKKKGCNVETGDRRADAAVAYLEADAISIQRLTSGPTAVVRGDRLSVGI